ncbi:MAG: rod-binding protein [Octadecabacter sp.]
MEIHTAQPFVPPASAPAESREDTLMAVAQSLEAAFLSEMLKSAGVGETPQDFGGGAGEDQFASFLREEQAKQMVQAGGIGLAQSMFDAMIAKSHE